MSVQYTRPTWDVVESWFDDHYNWEEVHPKHTRERTIHIPLPSDTKCIRVYTSINKSNNNGRDCGSDAIRTLVWDTENDVPVGGREYTKRIRTADDPTRYLKNMHKKICWLFQNWKIFDKLETTCGQCGDVMRGTEGEYGEYLFCTNDSCSNTIGIADKQCPECSGGMFKKDGKYGEFYSCEECDNTEDI